MKPRKPPVIAQNRGRRRLVKLEGVTLRADPVVCQACPKLKLLPPLTVSGCVVNYLRRALIMYVNRVKITYAVCPLEWGTRTTWSPLAWDI